MKTAALVLANRSQTVPADSKNESASPKTRLRNVGGCVRTAVADWVAPMLTALVVFSPTAQAVMTVTQTVPLSFGALVPIGPGATVTISPAGTRTGSSVFLSSKGVGAGSRAAFSVSGGTAGYTCDITLPLDGTAYLSGTGANMEAKTFLSSPAGTITLDSFGGGTVYVGATLAVGSPQSAGAYSVDFPLSIGACRP